MSHHYEAKLQEQIKDPWWYGGVAGIFACVCTHPVDLAKVRIQAALLPKQMLVEMLKNILKNDGILGLYSGLSATIL